MESEYDGANSLTARYTHGPGMDEPLIMERGGQSYFYHADGLGSITMLTDSGKNVVQSYVYDVFGNIVEKTGSLTNPYTYTGREYDPESGLYYYRMRYYDAGVGRFLQEDILSSLIELNKYVYVRNNPVSRSDPFGLWYIDINVSGGWWGGVTGGIIIGSEGVYPYAGGGIVTPGAGVSITWSPQDPTPGWTVGVGGTAGIAGQVGYSFENGGASFWEVGIGASYPTGWGVAGTAYYVEDPWKWPWEEEDGKKK